MGSDDVHSEEPGDACYKEKGGGLVLSASVVTLSRVGDL